MKSANGWKSAAALLCLAACAATLAGPLWAEETAALARTLRDKSGDAVVAVRIVVQVRVAVEGRQVEDEERTSEVNATIIDPSGLAVCSLSEVDPAQAMDWMMQENPDYKFETEVKDVKILRPDGEEIPAEVVLQDKDLDLAFIRPTEPPAQPMVAIDLSDDVKPDVLDQVVVLGRLGEVANRVGSIALDRVHAIVTKPRTFYITGLNTWMTGLGCPVFSPDGKAVGVLLVRSIPAVSSGGRGGNTVPVVLPAEDILEVAQQALQD